MSSKGINTMSVKQCVKWQQQWQGPIEIHCDASKSVPDPFPSVNPSVTTSKLPLPLPLGLFITDNFRISFKNTEHDRCLTVLKSLQMNSEAETENLEH